MLPYYYLLGESNVTLGLTQFTLLQRWLFFLLLLLLLLLLPALECEHLRGQEVFSVCCALRCCCFVLVAARQHGDDLTQVTAVAVLLPPLPLTRTALASLASSFPSFVCVVFQLSLVLALKNRHLLRHGQHPKEPKKALRALPHRRSIYPTTTTSSFIFFFHAAFNDQLLHGQPCHLLKLCHIRPSVPDATATTAVVIKQPRCNPKAALGGDEPYCFDLKLGLPQHVDGVVKALQPHKAPRGFSLAVP